MTNIHATKPRIIASAPETGLRECDLCYQTVPDLPYCDNCGIHVHAIDEALAKCWDPPWEPTPSTPDDALAKYWDPPWEPTSDAYIDWLMALPI